MYLLDKLIRYTALSTLMYVVLRYLPTVNMTPSKALTVVMLFIVTMIILESLSNLHVGTIDNFNGTQDNNVSCPCAVESMVSVDGSQNVTIDKIDSSNNVPIQITTTGVSNNEPIQATTTGASNNEIIATQSAVQVPLKPIATPPPVVTQTGVTVGDVAIPQKAVQHNIPTHIPDPNQRMVVGSTEDIQTPTDIPTNQAKRTSIPTTPPVNDDRYYWGSRYGKLGYDDRYGFGGMFYDEYPYYNRFRNNDKQHLMNTGTHIPNEMEGEGHTPYHDEIHRRKIEDRAHDLSGYAGRYQEVGSKSEKLNTVANSRRIEGPLDNEMPYTDYNHLPVASGYKSHAYEYGYSFLPPEKWYPQPPRPPVCITEKRCPVMPVFTQGAPADVKEFHSSRRISAPDLISSDYIGDKLNSGR